MTAAQLAKLVNKINCAVVIEPILYVFCKINWKLVLNKFFSTYYDKILTNVTREIFNHHKFSVKRKLSYLNHPKNDSLSPKNRLWSQITSNSLKTFNPTTKWTLNMPNKIKFNFQKKIYCDERNSCARSHDIFGVMSDYACWSLKAYRQKNRKR